MKTARPRRTTGGARAQRAVIVGGGLSGLAAGILLARSGWKVTILERDVRLPAESAEEAFRRWERPGVAQFRHSHTFLARLTGALRERLPDVLDLLRAQGAVELPLTLATPPGLDLGPRERGDGELVLLGCRRAAFEWALHATALREPNLTLREGVLVQGLHAKSRSAAPPVVRGVRVRELAPASDPGAGEIPWFARGPRDPVERTSRGDEVVTADLVVDATGRRSPASEWLRAIGAGAPQERSVPTGIFYFTRFYKLIGARPPGATTGLVAGDLGWIKLATFPGDRDTFSITVGTGIDDEPFRALSDPRAFEAMIAAFPQIAPWRARGVSRPIDGASTPVLVMGGLANRRRSFLLDGAPLAERFIPIGDAAYHTNPIYGRGATCAVLSAAALDDAIRAHPKDLVRAAVDFEHRTRREIEPFWDAAAAGDRANQARVEAAAPRSLWDLFSDPWTAMRVAIGHAIGLYFERGLIPASRQDATVYRAVMRVMNMLDDPRTGLLSPAVVARVLPVIAASFMTAAPPRAFPGPTREEALAILARTGRGKRSKAAASPKASGKPRLRLAASSRVAGHA